MASTVPVKSLDNVSTGTGATVDFLAAKHRVTAIVGPKGVTTGGLVEIQGSHDGTVWAVLDTVPLTSSRPFASTTAGGAFRYFRAVVISDVSGGGRVDVTFMEAD